MPKNETTKLKERLMFEFNDSVERFAKRCQLANLPVKSSYLIDSEVPLLRDAFKLKHPQPQPSNEPVTESGMMLSTPQEFLAAYLNPLGQDAQNLVAAISRQLGVNAEEAAQYIVKQAAPILADLRRQQPQRILGEAVRLLGQEEQNQGITIELQEVFNSLDSFRFQPPTLPDQNIPTLTAST